MTDDTDGTPPHDEPTPYRVGYRNPPIEHQFTPGKSANPNGRSIGARGRRTVARVVANELHDVKIDGMPPRLSTLELVLLTLRNEAVKGNVGAIQLVESLVTKYGPSQDKETPGVLVAPATLTPEEWIANARQRNAELEAKEAAAVSDDTTDQGYQQPKLDDIQDETEPMTLANCPLVRVSRVIR